MPDKIDISKIGNNPAQVADAVLTVVIPAYNDLCDDFADTVSALKAELRDVRSLAVGSAAKPPAPKAAAK